MLKNRFFVVIYDDSDKVIDSVQTEGYPSDEKIEEAIDTIAAAHGLDALSLSAKVKKYFAKAKA